MAVKRRSARGRAQRISNRQRGRPQPDFPTTAAPPPPASTSNLHLQPTSLLAQGEVDPDVEVRRFAVLQVETEVAFGRSGFRAFEHLFAQMLNRPDAQML